MGKHARIEIADVKTFLMTPAPSSRPVLCYIVRDKGSAKMYPKYSLFLEDGNRFLLSARKRKKSRSSNYLLSLHKDELARDAPSFFGKVRSNFVGTDFLIFDKGDKQDGSRQEYGVVTYQYNVLGTRGPRKMTAAISMLDEQGKRLYKGGANSMLERWVGVTHIVCGCLSLPPTKQLTAATLLQGQGRRCWRRAAAGTEKQAAQVERFCESTPAPTGPLLRCDPCAPLG